jgi:hypothetical protein
MMGSQQATLFGGSFGTSDGDPDGGPSKMPKPKPKAKVKSLDDFFRPMRFIGAPR